MSKLIAENSLYAITIEKVKSQMTLDGTDQVYSIYNKETGVVEGRAPSLPEALGYMHNLNKAFEDVRKAITQITADDQPPSPPASVN